jgi:hypothetical protein
VLQAPFSPEHTYKLSKSYLTNSTERSSSEKVMTVAQLIKKLRLSAFYYTPTFMKALH